MAHRLLGSCPRTVSPYLNKTELLLLLSNKAKCRCLQIGFKIPWKERATFWAWLPMQILDKKTKSIDLAPTVFGPH